MPPLTRRETSAVIRERLVETARALFVEQGYHATAVATVAHGAGYSKGAIFSSFASKHDLGLAALDSEHGERIESLAAALVPADSFDSALRVFATWAEQNIGDVGWTSFEVELAASTRHVPHVRAELAARRREIAEGLAALLEAKATAYGITLSRPSRDLADLLLTLGIGLGVQRAVDPDVSLRPLLEQIEAITTTAAAGREA